MNNAPAEHQPSRFRNFRQSPFNEWVLLGPIMAFLVWGNNSFIATNGFTGSALVTAVVLGALLGIGLARVIVIPSHPIRTGTRILHGLYQAIWLGTCIGLMLGDRSLESYAIMAIVGGGLFGVFQALLIKPNTKYDAYLEDQSILEKRSAWRTLALAWPFVTIGLGLGALLLLRSSEMAVLSIAVMLCFAPLYRNPKKGAVDERTWLGSGLLRMCVIIMLINAQSFYGYMAGLF